jgi:hypothetical protein
MRNQSTESTKNDSKNQSKKPAEDEIVQIIREYFDDETGYKRVDKLSQAYLYINLTDKDLEKIKSLEWKKKKLEDKKNSISHKKEKKSEEELQQIEEELKKLDDLKIKCQNITLYKLRYLFKAYCENPEFIPDINLPKVWGIEEDKNRWEKISFWWNQKPDGVLRKRIWEVAKGGTIFATLIGLIQYCGEIPKRQQQNYLQAWQLINTAGTQSGQGGRVEALEYLNKDKSWPYTPACKEKDNKCLIGVKIQKANLNGVNLEGANLTSSEFQYTSFRDANLKGAIFKDAHLECANFSGAKNVNLDGAIKCKTKMPDGSEDNSKCDCPEIKS